ncbi:hypothetical protein CQW23_17313 [Capsicum baccatum]|uniref:Uncharacterized protein n=1 Tax=Capsicum baccatum TaxID=33114 RepID=A0A2G2WDH5_CAPBA|nr:hypothetical protein CQW23_17313 [Capsicum baccatum]
MDRMQSNPIRPSEIANNTQERTRYANTKEKLSFAMTKGKGLVQQCDDLKESLSEKASKLERNQIKLQEKSNSLKAAEQTKDLLRRTENLVASLQEALIQKEMILQKCEEILSKAIGSEQFQSTDTVQKVKWLADDINALNETSLQLQRILNNTRTKFSLIRENLSMAVKKGRGLFQIDKLSVEMVHIPQLEADLISMKNQRDQLEKFLEERNNMLQKVIESLDGIILPADLGFQDHIEKVKWILGYLRESQIIKMEVEQELGRVKDEASSLASQLLEVPKTIKSLEDALSAANNNISQLLDDKKELEASSLANQLLEVKKTIKYLGISSKITRESNGRSFC